MKAKWRFQVARLFAYSALLCSGTAAPETPDRILSFDAQITVDIHRSMYVEERVEIVNHNGLFANGFHRQLRIKPLSPQRLRQGSFQAISAKVDGLTSDPRTSEAQNVLDIEIAAGDGTLPRGNHLIELSYVAKHQFAIYDRFEDLEQDVSGEWPVSIERASVTLNLPQGLPNAAGISADTGTNSDFQFDCVRTNLASGVRFETTHPLPPGSRLSISLRFPHPSYFTSDVGEQGYRAVLQNGPFLVPGAVSLVGLIVFFAAGIHPLETCAPQCRRNRGRNRQRE